MERKKGREGRKGEGGKEDGKIFTVPNKLKMTLWVVWRHFMSVVIKPSYGISLLRRCSLWTSGESFETAVQGEGAFT